MRGGGGAAGSGGGKDVVNWTLESARKVWEEASERRGRKRAWQGLVAEKSPLRLAVENGDASKVLACLQDSPGDVDCVWRSWTPLMAASEKGLVDIMWLLISHRADIDAANRDGRTALYFAIKPSPGGIAHPNLDAIKLLLESRADTHVRYDKGTPLMVACDKGLVDVVRLLISYRADIDATNRDGRTALHFAINPSPGGIAHPNPGVIRLLLESRADTHEHLDTWHQSALEQIILLKDVDKEVVYNVWRQFKYPNCNTPGYSVDNMFRTIVHDSLIFPASD